MKSSSGESFSEFMAEALYGEKGFYTLGNGAGRSRDYITSPEVGDLFGYVIAEYIDSWYSTIEEEDGIVVEAGCGSGSLAASIARVGLASAENLSYNLVDISPVHRQSASEKLSRANPLFEWSIHEVIPKCDRPTLVIANELFDNLIFDIVSTHDIYHSYEPDKYENIVNVGATFGRAPTYDNLREANVPVDIDNYLVPYHIGVIDWFEELRKATQDTTDLSILTFDYIKSVADMQDGNWMRLYTNNQRIVGIDNVLIALERGITGDITTDIIKEDLYVILDRNGFSKITMTRQAQWLIEHSIEIYSQIGRSDRSSNVYGQLQSFVTHENSGQSNFDLELNVLTDEHGLGAFTVVEARRQI